MEEDSLPRSYILNFYDDCPNTRGPPEVTVPIFFSHSGNTEVTKFGTFAQDSYTDSYKNFRVNSTRFYTCLVCVMMNWKETSPSDCEVRNVNFFNDRK